MKTTELYCEDPGWLNALTLPERIGIVHSQRSEVCGSNINVELAERRMHSWRGQRPFTAQSYFEQRLEVEQVTEKEFFAVLGESVESLRTRLWSQPSWLDVLERAFSRLKKSGIGCESGHNTERPPKDERLGWLTVIRPLIEQGRERVRDFIRVLEAREGGLPFDVSSVEEIVCGILWEPLSMRLSRTMTLELNVARLQEKLKGDSPQERFRSFVERLDQHDVAISILREYPVLARELTLCVDHWVERSQEFLDHLCSDWKAIRTTFSGERDPGLLCKVVGGGPATHIGRAGL